MSFKDLKKNRKEQFDKIASEFKEANAPAQTYDKQEDTRLWYPAGDEKTDSGSAIIRFLPPTDNAPKGMPYVKVYKHAFQGPTGSWLSEVCPTTIGKPCPVCEANREYWNSGIDSDKKIASQRKRKVQYYSNIYIIKDQHNPENNGTVRIFRYGKKIFDMLNDQMNPSFDDVESVNPFDLWEGASLRLRFKKEDGFRNYNASTFDSPAPLFEDDEKLEEIYNKMYDLNEFVDPAGIHDYGQIKERLIAVTSGKPKTRNFEEEATEEESSWANKTTTTTKGSESVDDDDTEFDKFFNNLAV